MWRSRAVILRFNRCRRSERLLFHSEKLSSDFDRSCPSQPCRVARNRISNHTASATRRPGGDGDPTRLTRGSPSAPGGRGDRDRACSFSFTVRAARRRYLVCARCGRSRRLIHSKRLSRYGHRPRSRASQVRVNRVIHRSAATPRSSRSYSNPRDVARSRPRAARADADSTCPAARCKTR